MLQEQFKSILARLLATICKDGDVPTYNGLKRGPRLPITLLERTMIPRTIPTFLTIRYPGISRPDVTIEKSTRGISSSPWDGRLSDVYRCDSNRSEGARRAMFLCYSLKAYRHSSISCFFCRSRLGCTSSGTSCSGSATCGACTPTREGFYAPRIAVLCPCKGMEPGLEPNLVALTEFDRQKRDFLHPCFRLRSRGEHCETGRHEYTGEGPCADCRRTCGVRPKSEQFVRGDRAIPRGI